MLEQVALPTRLRFDNRFVNNLPADTDLRKQPHQVYGAAYSCVMPTAVSQPELLAYSAEVADILNMDEEWVKSAEFAQIFGGNTVLNGMDPYAMAYGGHQFGNWAGQLGDGRAINLGEIVNDKGEHWTVQLKGAGPTPYSRTADGLAVLRSSVREFLCSEAMVHLGVPTTRALSLVLTGENVLRDMFYDGNAAYEKGAVVCRAAPSMTRFGNFQLPASRGDADLLKQLVDHTIRVDFPHLGEPSSEVYAQWFQEVCDRTADMIIHWMRVGFVHGVMNTDNMSILGLTIDYGPYGWLEDYDPNWTPNTTDAGGRRYRFGNQPQIAHWNLAQLGNALVGLIGDVEPLQNAIDSYAERYSNGYLQMMGDKLGLTKFDAERDADLITTLQETLVLVETDMTIFFRNLANLTTDHVDVAALSDDALLDVVSDAFYVMDQLTAEKRAAFATWLRHYAERVQQNGIGDHERAGRMNAVNPKYVLRNYMAQLAIDDAEEGDYRLINEVLDLLRHPYKEQPDREKWFAKRPDWARHRAGCSMLSCSS